MHLRHNKVLCGILRYVAVSVKITNNDKAKKSPTGGNRQGTKQNELTLSGITHPKQCDYTTSGVGLASHTLKGGIFYGKIQSEKTSGRAIHDANLSGHGGRQEEI